MNTLENNFDSLEQIIFEGGLRITGVNFYPQIDLMIIVLNNRKVLTMPISKYKNLSNVSLEKLEKVELISNGTGLHWTEIDEDLSLKGFLKESIASGNISLVA